MELIVIQQQLDQPRLWSAAARLMTLCAKTFPGSEGAAAVRWYRMAATATAASQDPAAQVRVLGRAAIAVGYEGASLGVSNVLADQAPALTDRPSLGLLHAIYGKAHAAALRSDRTTALTQSGRHRARHRRDGRTATRKAQPDPAHAPQRDQSLTDPGLVRGTRGCASPSLGRLRSPTGGGALAGRNNASADWSPRVILLPTMDDLVTARLVLHPMTVNEAEQVVAGESDSGARWAPGYPTDGDASAARRFLGACANTGDPQPFGNYQIRCREDGQVIGGVDFHGPADENGSVTIGYGLIPSARGKGYASEAVRGLLLFARARGVTCVKGDADHDNIASQHVMMAAGMRPAGEDERVRYFEIAWPDTTAITDPHS